MRPRIAPLSRFLLVPTLIAMASPENVVAQAGLASLPPGARVRVTASSLGPGARPARVVSASADTLAVHPDDAKGFAVMLRRAEISRLDVSTGQRTRKKRFALIGLGTGVVVGWLVGAATYSDPCVTNPAVCSGWFYETRGSDAFGGAVAGGLFGTVAGAIAGQVWRTDRWEPHPRRIQSGALRIVPAPSRGPAWRSYSPCRCRDAIVSARRVFNVRACEPLDDECPHRQYPA